MLLQEYQTNKGDKNTKQQKEEEKRGKMRTLRRTFQGFLQGSTKLLLQKIAPILKITTYKNDHQIHLTFHGIKK